MLIFIYGQNTYGSFKKLNEIIAYYKKNHKSGLNLSFFDFKKDDFKDFKNEIRTNSIFKEKKLIILRNAFSNSDFKEKFLKEAKESNRSEDVIVFYEENDPDKRTALFRFLEKYGKSQKFEPLEGLKLGNWIKKEFKNYGAEIEPAAIEKLIRLAGNDIWRLSNEIKKLINFKKNKFIEEKDVNLLIRADIEIDIFKTIDALASKNKRLALYLIRRHLEKGESPFYILSMIIFQFRNLLVVGDALDKRMAYGDILKIAKLHPFVFRKTCVQLGKFNLQELKNIYRKIFQTDLSVKTGRLRPEAALEMLVAEI